MDANQSKTRHRAQAARAADQPINESQLANFEKSDAAQNVMVKRIIGALRRAWSDSSKMEERLAELEKPAEPEKWPAVLVVVHVDGWCEIYADPNVSIGTLELRPWDSEDETIFKVPYGYQHLLEGTPRKFTYPNFTVRPNEFSLESLARVYEWFRRVEFYDKFKELEKLLTPTR